MPTFVFKAVSAEAKRRLDIGDDVIRIARGIVAYGAGNQEQTVNATACRSVMLTIAVQQHPTYVWDRPLRNGGVTAAYGAGNCQDQAAVVYTILRSKLAVNERTSFCVHNGIHHSFSTIGQPLVDANDEVIIEDPWPINPQADLWKDHFCFEGDLSNLNGFTVLRTKAGGKGPDFIARLNKHAPVDAPAYRNMVATTQYDTAAYLQNAQGLWNHTHCAQDAATMVYRVRLTWVPDDTRPKCSKCKAEFGRLRWRHHCRRCGEVFCDACTPRRSIVGVPATRPGDQPVAVSNGRVRVCVACDDQIKADGFGG